MYRSSKKVLEVADFPENALRAGSYRARGDWLAKSLLLFFGFILAFGGFEVVFRLYTKYFPPHPTRRDRPTVYYAAADAKKPQDYRYLKVKPPGTFRIAALGDSFTYPTNMHFDDAYPKRLERMLRLGSSFEEPQIEVMNFGEMGASSKSEISMFQRALHYQPDLAILEITLNDPEPKSLHVERQKDPEKFQFGKLEITKENHPILARWKSLAYLIERVHNNGTLREVVSYYRDMYRPDGRWVTFEKSLREIKRIADEKHVAVVAMVFPLFYTSLDERYPFRDVHQKIHDLLESLNMPNLDLLPYFENMNPERLIVLPGEDSHPNEIAHRIAADVLYQWLDEKGLVPEKFLIRKRFYRRGIHPERIPAAPTYPLQSPEWISRDPEK